MRIQQNQYAKMTETPVSKLIVSLSIPTVISMLVTNVYNIVDTAFVGTLGTSASGAVGIVFGIMTIIQAIGFTFGQGSGSIISRLLGRRDPEKASTIASTGFACAFVLGLLITFFCLLFLNPLLKFLGSTDTILPYAREYTIYILLAAPFTVTSFVLNNILRFEGKALFAMIGLMTGAVLNIGGDALLIFVLHLGIKGAAISTAVSQIISFSILISAFFTGKTQSKLSLSCISIKAVLVMDIVGSGLPSLLRQGLNSIATILLNSIVKPYGDAAIAAMSIVNRIFFFFFSVAVGVGQGFQPVSGFNYGAKKYERLKKAYWFTIVLSEALVVVLGSAVFFNAPGCIWLLRNDMQVVEIGTRALRLQCIASLLLPFCMTTEMLLQSTGQKLPASILSSFRGGLFFIPLLVILSMTRGIAGVQEAQPLAYFLSFFPALYCAPRYFKKLGKSDSNLAVKE